MSNKNDSKVNVPNLSHQDLLNLLDVLFPTVASTRTTAKERSATPVAQPEEVKVCHKTNKPCTKRCNKVKDEEEVKLDLNSQPVQDIFTLIDLAGKNGVSIRRVRQIVNTLGRKDLVKYANKSSLRNLASQGVLGYRVNNGKQHSYYTMA